MVLLHCWFGLVDNGAVRHAGYVFELDNQRSYIHKLISSFFCFGGNRDGEVGFYFAGGKSMTPHKRNGRTSYFAYDRAYKRQFQIALFA